ncbi:MAG: nucleotidyltransferase domain-containing protein [Oscillospiraceae bacterium]|jgi:predicted nucleotidyltransferase|nr:nucleotidyltransferase domain-containing protein [Oscillospiraceae bacterium]
MDKQKAQEEIQQIADLIRQTVPVERIYLFGSYAYGEPNEKSDYDFFVVIPDGSMRPLEATQKIHRAIAHTPLMTPTDVMAEHKSRFEQTKRFNSLERKVEQEGRLLYG